MCHIAVSKMSHVSVVATGIKNANQKILKATLQQLAKELGLELKEKTSVHDYYGKHLQAEYSLWSKEAFRGIGVNVVNGEVKTTGDFMGCELLAEQVKQHMLQNYVSLATVAAFNSVGLTVDQYQRRGEINVIHAYEGM